MYNNGLVKTFGILFTLVSIYQLSFTFISSKIESDAQKKADIIMGAADAEAAQIYVAHRNTTRNFFY